MVASMYTKVRTGFEPHRTDTTDIVFSCNYDDLTNIKTYHLASSMFPTETSFVDQYPQAQWKEYFSTGLYNDLRTKLPIIFKHYEDDTFKELIQLSSEIDSFARSVAQTTDPAYTGGLSVAMLRDNAKLIQTSCGNLRTKLLKFREIMITDKQTITSLDQKLDLHLKQAPKSLGDVAAKQKVAEEDVKKQTETFHPLIPFAFIMGGIFGSAASVRAGSRQMMEVWAPYLELVEKNKNELKSLNECLVLTKKLAKQVSDVHSAIQGALNTVLDLSGTCGHMEAHFESFVALLAPGKGQSQYQGDLKPLAVQWGKVRHVAKSFQMVTMLPISTGKTHAGEFGKLASDSGRSTGGSLLL